jgi:hypothetical protein
MAEQEPEPEPEPTSVDHVQIEQFEEKPSFISRIVDFFSCTSLKNIPVVSENSITPWNNNIINAHYLWQGNFVGASPTTQYYFNSVSAPQNMIDGSGSTTSNLVSSSGNYTYSDQIPIGMNCVVLFTGYSNAQKALDNLTNYSTGSNMFDTAYNYLKDIPNHLLSLSLGGGVAETGGWSTGSSGAIYSIYQCATKAGVSFSYTETGTGNTLSGVGTGTLNYNYNSLTFDIECWSGESGSTGQDFIHLFNYLKHGENSMFNGFEMIIIVSHAHSCSNYDGTGQTMMSDLLKDTTGSFDYVSPQIYTQNIGTTNEYCANYNILWGDYVSMLKENATYKKYGVNMILPSINFANLYTSGGTNNNNPPNLYWYQSSGGFGNPPTAAPSGYKTIAYDKDGGAVDFFNTLFGESSTTLGGYIQWVNGTIA